MSRVGRENQAYTKEGSRLVAGGVIVNEKGEILMITAMKNLQRWILPKGGVELDEVDDYSKAAIRECWEEAGVRAEHIRSLGSVEDQRPNARYAHEVDYDKSKAEFVDRYGKSLTIKTQYHWYEMTGITLLNEWPESNRDRKWVSYSECLNQLYTSQRFESIEIVKRWKEEKERVKREK